MARKKKHREITGKPFAASERAAYRIMHPRKISNKRQQRAARRRRYLKERRARLNRLGKAMFAALKEAREVLDAAIQQAENGNG